MGEENKSSGPARLEVADIEKYKPDEEQKFSHQALVMKAMKRVIELGGHELVSGINETTYDQTKNMKKIVYKEDTQQAFCEAIISNKMIMVADLESGEIKKIEAILETLTSDKEYLLEEQWKGWDQLDEPRKRIWNQSGKSKVHEQFFNEHLPYKDLFIEQKINGHRAIFEILVEATKRLDYYQEESFEA